MAAAKASSQMMAPFIELVLLLRTSGCTAPDIIAERTVPDIEGCGEILPLGIGLEVTTAAAPPSPGSAIGMNSGSTSADTNPVLPPPPGPPIEPVYC
jgi:hypothetical protein